MGIPPNSAAWHCVVLERWEQGKVVERECHYSGSSSLLAGRKHAQLLNDKVNATLVERQRIGTFSVRHTALTQEEVDACVMYYKTGHMKGHTVDTRLPTLKEIKP